MHWVVMQDMTTHQQRQQLLPRELQHPFFLQPRLTNSCSGQIHIKAEQLFISVPNTGRHISSIFDRRQ